MKAYLLLLVTALAGCVGQTESQPCQDAGTEVDAGRECVVFRYNRAYPSCGTVPEGWSCTHNTDLCFCCED